MKNKKINMKELHKQYFESYPEAKMLYFTEDGNCFLKKSPALDHARKAKIKWECVDNPAFIKEITAENEAAEKEAAEAAKTAAQEALKAWNAEQSDYYTDLALANDLELELTDKKHETITDALEAAQGSTEPENK